MLSFYDPLLSSSCHGFPWVMVGLWQVYLYSWNFWTFFIFSSKSVEKWPSYSIGLIVRYLLSKAIEGSILSIPSLVAASENLALLRVFHGIFSLLTTGIETSGFAEIYVAASHSRKGLGHYPIHHRLRFRCVTPRPTYNIENDEYNEDNMMIF